MRERFVIYDTNEVPYRVYDIRVFCHQYDLEEEPITEVIEGRRRFYLGWHMDMERTFKLRERAEEIFNNDLLVRPFGF